MFFSYGEQKTHVVEDGVSRKILAHAGKLLMMEVSFRKGIHQPPHSHPHEQISYIKKGSFIYYLGNEAFEMHEGDSCYVPPNVPHTVKSLEDSVIVDCFTPQREDLLKEKTP